MSAGGQAPPGGRFGPPPAGGFGPPLADDFGPPPAGGFGKPPAGSFGVPPPGGFGAPPGGGYGAPPGGGYGAPQYEFTALENDTIRKIAFWAKALSITMFVSAGLSLFGCNIINVATYVAIAIPLIMAGTTFQKVADTRGSDISHMMQALQTLGTSFLVRIVIWITMVGITLLVMLLGFIFFASIMGMIFNSTRGG